MTYPDYFIRKDFAYYDSCSAQVVGNLEDRIYDARGRLIYSNVEVTEMDTERIDSHIYHARTITETDEKS